MTPADRAALRAACTAHEGRRQMAYDDATGKTLRRGETLRGNLTIGVGWNLSAHGLPQDLIDLLLDRAISDAEAALCGALPWTLALDAVRRRVLIELVFNMGLSGLLTFKRLLQHAEAGRWAAAAHELLDSPYPRQVGDRAVVLAAQLETGVDPGPGTATAASAVPTASDDSRRAPSPASPAEPSHGS